MDRTSHSRFVLVELLIFLAQIAVFGSVIWLLSGQMASEQSVAKVLMARLENNSVTEFNYTILALVFVFGLVSLAHYLLPEGVVGDVAGAVMDEFPRTMYFFGANLTAAAAMAGVYAAKHPGTGSPAGFYLAACFFAVMFFVLGCGLRFLLRVRKRKKGQATEPAPNAA